MIQKNPKIDGSRLCRHPLIPLLSIFCVSQGFCHEEQNDSASEKIYLHPSQISILPDGIFIWLDNRQISVDAIYADCSGIYASSKVKFGWTCPRCKHENKWYANQCKNCGYR